MEDAEDMLTQALNQAIQTYIEEVFKLLDFYVNRDGVLTVAYHEQAARKRFNLIDLIQKTIKEGDRETMINLRQKLREGWALLEQAIE